MKGNKLQEMSTEALLKQKKTIGALTGMLVGALLVLLIVAIILSFEQGFTPLVIIPFALLPIVLLNLNSLKEIKKVLNSRNEVL